MMLGLGIVRCCNQGDIANPLMTISATSAGLYLFDQDGNACDLTCTTGGGPAPGMGTSSSSSIGMLGIAAAVGLGIFLFTR